MTENRYVLGYFDGSFVASSCVITSLRLVHGGGHVRITVFNRGGNAGTLTVDVGDVENIASRLLPKWEPEPSDHPAPFTTHVAAAVDALNAERANG